MTTRAAALLRSDTKPKLSRFTTTSKGIPPTWTKLVLTFGSGFSVAVAWVHPGGARAGAAVWVWPPPPLSEQQVHPSGHDHA